jgi:hypothetical protein
VQVVVLGEGDPVVQRVRRGRGAHEVAAEHEDWEQTQPHSPEHV